MHETAGESLGKPTNWNLKPVIKKMAKPIDNTTELLVTVPGWIRSSEQNLSVKLMDVEILMSTWD